MLIDTHCHLDSAEFDTDRSEVIDLSQKNGVQQIVIPAVMRDNFVTVRDLAHQFSGGYYALGIHPMYVRYATEDDLTVLEQMIQHALQTQDSRLVAIGEIGLDFFVPEIKQGQAREQQELFYKEQLKLARKYDLPVLLHVRRSQDTVLKYLRQIPVQGGITHAFNGSEQQAQSFIKLGFALGFGGAMTFTRALQIRRLATELDLSHLVLETDAPDIPPAWLDKENPRNSPVFLPQMAQVLAELRGVSADYIAQITTQNAQRVLPRLQG